MTNKEFKGFVQLSSDQYAELKLNGSLVIEGRTIEYSPLDTIYMITDAGNMIDVANTTEGEQNDVVLNITNNILRAQLNQTIKTKINNKQDKLTFDTIPTMNSNNPVTSDGIKTYVDNKFNGAAKAIAYDSYATMITAFNSLTKDSYNVGQNINIVTLDVPDLWVSSVEQTNVPYTYVDDTTFTDKLKINGYVQVGYYKLSALETQKVDLTDYQKKLTAGTNITIDANNVISASGGSTSQDKIYRHLVRFSGGYKIGTSATDPSDVIAISLIIYNKSNAKIDTADALKTYLASIIPNDDIYYNARGIVGMFTTEPAYYADIIGIYQNLACQINLVKYNNGQIKTTRLKTDNPSELDLFSDNVSEV